VPDGQVDWRRLERLQRGRMYLWYVQLREEGPSAPDDLAIQCHLASEKEVTTSQFGSNMLNSFAAGDLENMDEEITGGFHEFQIVHLGPLHVFYQLPRALPVGGVPAGGCLDVPRVGELTIPESSKRVCNFMCERHLEVSLTNAVQQIGALLPEELT
jgi:hypothetical protein